MAANAAAPSGFETLNRVDGAVPNYSMSEEFIAWNYGTRIAYNDPVYRYTDGTLRLYAAAGTTIHGIFRGCRYLDPGTKKTEFYPAWLAPTLVSTTTVYALVDTDPNLVFMAQVVGTALTQASMGLNMDITTSTSGLPNAAGRSVCSLSGTAANTATLPFRLLSIVRAPAINAAYIDTNDNQWVKVTMNTSDSTTRTGQA